MFLQNVRGVFGYKLGVFLVLFYTMSIIWVANLSISRERQGGVWEIFRRTNTPQMLQVSRVENPFSTT